MIKRWGENIVLSNDNNYVVRISSYLVNGEEARTILTCFIDDQRVAQQDDIRVDNDVICRQPLRFTQL